MSPEIIKVLLVEDDLGDVELVKQSLKRSKLHVDLDCVIDGQECLDYLRRVGKYKDASKPDLILLDLNMPKKDGRQVLLEIKADPPLRRIPVVVLTTSESDVDILKSYDLGANCYVTKPVDFHQFSKIVNEIAEFWFTVVKLPDHRGA
ncbi:MAG: response regulator [Candidatus Omnitrophica bacterium]|nr:response regulator [Candidatus Omnitrophota bacterium]